MADLSVNTARLRRIFTQNRPITPKADRLYPRSAFLQLCLTVEVAPYIPATFNQAQMKSYLLTQNICFDPTLAVSFSSFNKAWRLALAIGASPRPEWV